MVYHVYMAWYNFSIYFYITFDFEIKKKKKNSLRRKTSRRKIRKKMFDTRPLGIELGPPALFHRDTTTNAGSS